MAQQPIRIATNLISQVLLCIGLLLHTTAMASSRLPSRLLFLAINTIHNTVYTIHAIHRIHTIHTHHTIGRYYFAWASYYTRLLWAPALLGILFFLVDQYYIEVSVSLVPWYLRLHRCERVVPV